MIPRIAALAACAGLAGAVAGAANASCAYETPAQQRARAQVIFEGRALDGPTATGVQRFRVTRYLKGRGPRVVRVQTGYAVRGNTVVVTSVSIHVRRGERWRIFARGSASRVLRTTICDGSRRLARA